MLTIILLFALLTGPSPDEFADSIMGSSVEIESHGSGVIVMSTIDRSLILTNWHVISCDCGNPIVVIHGDNRYPARVLTSDRKVDLAILAIDVGGLPYAKPSMVPLKLLEEVWTVGFPAMEGPIPGKGIVTGLRVRDHIRTNVPGWFGSSGGGLFNAQGELVGIVRMIKVDWNGNALPFIMYAIPMDAITEFLTAPWEVDQYVGEESKSSAEIDGGDGDQAPEPRVEEPEESVEQDTYPGPLVF